MYHYQPDEEGGVGKKPMTERIGVSFDTSDPEGVKKTRRKYMKIYMREKRFKERFQEMNRGFHFPPELIDYNVQKDYNGDNNNLPKDVVKSINRREKERWNDVEPAWRAADPRKRQSWQEFLRDFLGQNYGAIAQSMLELYQNDKTQFMKFVMEMGKQGHPQAMQLEVNASVKTDDIYAKLQAMADMSKAIPGSVPEPTEFEVVDPQAELCNYETASEHPVHANDLMAEFETNNQNNINNENYQGREDI